MSKKVLFVATVDKHIELFHIPFLREFHKKNYEVHVATNTDKKIPFCDKKICIPIKRSPLALISNLKAINRLSKCIRDYDYDIVHCHTPVGGVVARMAVKRVGSCSTRVIYTAHGFHFYEGAPKINWLLFYPVEKYLAKYTDTLITINKEDYDRAKRKFSKRCKDIQYVPGVGVDIATFRKPIDREKKERLCKELGIDEYDLVLICIGRLDHNKNQVFLLDVVRYLLKNGVKCRLLLVGSDECNGEFQNYAKRIGVSEHVSFLGFRTDVCDLMQISNIVVSASRREGLPVNIIEAAASGLPIVMVKCRGCLDIKAKYDNLFISRENVDDFVLKIKKASECRRKIGELMSFSTEYVMERMSAIYGF